MDRWLVSSVAVLMSNLVLTLATRAQEALQSSAHSMVAGSAAAAGRADEPVGSLWLRRLPKDAAQHARRKELARRYRQAGANPEFLDRMVGGDVEGALKELRRQAQTGDPAAINLYGDFAYWNCFLHRTPEQLDSYAATQLQESNSLPPADGEWFRTAFMDDIAFDKSVAAACSGAVNVDEAFDMVDERAKQGDAASLYLASMTVSKMVDGQRLLRAAAIAGSPDAQFEIAFIVLGGHQPELLGTGPDALDLGDLLRQSAEQIPQAEGNLAECEFHGCAGAGIAADPAAGIRTALSAAEHGFFEALVDIGPHVSPSLLDPIDMEAWKLIQASVGLQCGGSWSNVEAMKVALAALSAPAVAAAARQRAEQLWARYGAGLGC